MEKNYKEGRKDFRKEHDLSVHWREKFYLGLGQSQESCTPYWSPGRGTPGEEGEETRGWLCGDSRGPPSSPLLSSWEAP